MSAATVVEMSRVGVDAPTGARVLDGLSFELEAGSAVALVGPVGSGKTTVLRLAARLAAPTRGTVFVFSHDVTKLGYEASRSHAQRIGFVFESTGLLGNLSVEANIALPLRYDAPSELVDARVRHIAQELGIERELGEPSFRANASVRKRALFARALVREPELLLCDEPQVGLTLREATLVRDAVERRRAGGMSVLYADHDGELAPFLVDRLLYLESGELRATPSLRPTRTSIVPLPDRASLPIAAIYGSES